MITATREGAGINAIARRELLLGAIVPALAPLCQIAARSDMDLAVAALLDDYVQYAVERHPEWITMLGLDRGAFAQTRARLDDRSIDQLRRDRQVLATRQQQLNTVDRAHLSARSAIYYETYQFELMRQRAVLDWRGLGRPYVIDQLDSGSYSNVPRLLASQHRVESEEDVNAWLARLQAFSKVLDQEVECVRFDAAQGIIPPSFVIDVTVAQLQELAQTPALDSFLVKSLATRTAEHGIAGDHARLAANIWQNDVVPALRRQIEALRALRPSAASHAGIWHLPDGEALYSALLQYETTTAMSPADLHALGLQTVAEINGHIDESMRRMGMEEGSVAQRLRSMFEDPRFRYSRDESGRERILRDAYRIADRARAHLTESFTALPHAGFTIQRVPAYLEAGTAGGQYDPPSVDGLRPGIFWLNVEDPSDTSSFLLPTILHHEGLPGHHLQFSLAYDTASLPLALKLWDFAGYSEGWATYAEQLADEWGLFDDDVWRRIGYLQQALLRAVRLVVDTGLHAMRWSRAQALSYLFEALGSPEISNVAEVNRYCVEPAQACSYMVGKLAWLRLRERARNELGKRFDIRDFHDTALRSGSMPLPVLDRMIQDYIRLRRG
ncbi:MAG TPA: DUF885 family protein [Xanthobacteraceae bacterium]